MPRRLLSLLLLTVLLTGCDSVQPAAKPAPSARIGDAQPLRGLGTQLDVTLLTFLDPAPTTVKRIPGHRPVAVQLRVANTGDVDARLEPQVWFFPAGEADGRFAKPGPYGEPTGVGVGLPDVTLAKGTFALGWLVGHVSPDMRIATVSYSIPGADQQAREGRWDVSRGTGTAPAGGAPAPGNAAAPLALGTPAEITGKSNDRDPTEVRLSVAVTKFESGTIGPGDTAHQVFVELTARNTGSTAYKIKDDVRDYRRVSLSNDLGETVVQPNGFDTGTADLPTLPPGGQQTWLIPLLLVPPDFVPTTVQFAGVDNGAVRWALPR